MMKKCIILANGRAPSKTVFNYFSIQGYETLICADGGANNASKLDLIPDYIIGDLDSIKPEVYDYYFDQCKIIQIKSQNDTDVEKCLKFAMKNKFNDVILLGSTGNRLDHSFCNLGIVLKYFNRARIRIIHERSILSAYSGKVLINTWPNETISLYGFDSKTRIYSRGLRYELRNISLPFGKKESTSNVALKDKLSLNIKGGIIFVIRDLHTMVKYGLL